MGYKGRDFLTVALGPLVWMVALLSSQSIRKLWETHGLRADLVKVFLLEPCPAQIQRYLVSSRGLPENTARTGQWTQEEGPRSLPWFLQGQ